MKYQETLDSNSGSISRRNVLCLWVATLVWSTQKNVLAKVNTKLERVSELPDETFDNTDELLWKVRINPKTQTAIALLRKKDSRVFVIVIEDNDIRVQAWKWWGFNKWLLRINVAKWWLIEDLKIEGDKDGELFRYWIIWYKDEDGITLLDRPDSDNLYGKIKDVPVQRRNFDPEEVVRQDPERIRQYLRGNLRIKPIHLWYTEKHRERSIEKWDLPDKESLKWRIIRSYRWKSITDSVEDKYRIPRWLVLAMMAQEWYGDPSLPNLNNDGWLWLIHIQAVNAHDFWLKTLPRYTRRMRDSQHANEITYVKTKEKNVLHKMIKYDDRFHPILAVDVAARFLVEHYRRVKKHNPKMNEDELWNLALRWYSGRRHTWKWWYGWKVRDFQKNINDPSFIRQIQEEFPKYNVVIEGKKVGFDDYIKYFSRMAENYELQKYRQAHVA